MELPHVISQMCNTHGMATRMMAMLGTRAINMYYLLAVNLQNKFTILKVTHVVHTQTLI